MKIHLKKEVIKCAEIKRSWGTMFNWYTGNEEPGNCSGEFDFNDVMKIVD